MMVFEDPLKSTDKVIRQTILRYVNEKENHNKYYELTILKDKKLFSVLTRWGRIENFENETAQRQYKGTHNNLENANIEVDKIISSKKKKGYKLWTDTGDKAVKKIAPEKETNTSTEWWHQPNAIIEEREV